MVKEESLLYIPKRKPAVPIPASAFDASSETTVTWLSGAGFLVNCRGTCLLIDPVLTKDPKDSSRSEAGLPLKVDFPILADAIPAHCHHLPKHDVVNTVTTIGSITGIVQCPSQAKHEVTLCRAANQHCAT